IPVVQSDPLASLDNAPAAAYDYLDEEPLAPSPLVDEALAEQESFEEPTAAPVSGGVITRVAADAIVGPVVDALPVEPAPADTERDDFGRVAPLSAPLAYELTSNTTLEAPGIMMRWLDDEGLIAPLGVSSAPAASDAQSTLDGAEPLGFEADAALSGIYTLPHASEPLGFEAVAVPEPHGAMTPRDDENDTAPIALEPDAASDGVGADDTPIAPRANKGVITRSLEALWDELPQGNDL
ncbi:MAG: hypothetical protein KGO05_06060, partial [Chloroflexota bacterium]|nr:hypothetical protein [Chloroflexota bacterium]